CHRRAFANFLDRLAIGSTSPEDWSLYAVNHYVPAPLEDIRRQCVQIAIDARETFPDNDQHRAKLREWANALRIPRLPESTTPVAI
ncbi:MAG TPA: hypothetical protein VD994_13960, partial [Prosthecobacter sp.]|nr:hypothetical protein [Prosthecobacter sp.]